MCYNSGRAPLAQLVRAPSLYLGGSRFKSWGAHFFYRIKVRFILVKYAVIVLTKCYTCSIFLFSRQKNFISSNHVQH